MTTRYVMGIDNGSQSTKVAIYDLDGQEVAFGSATLRETLTPKPGVVVHPEEDLWDSVKAGMDDCLSNFNGDKKAIEAIGLCTIRCCRVLLQEDGELASPVQSWMDERLSKPYEHTDDSVQYVTTTSGYLGLRMTGEHRDTAANCEVYWPLDWETLDWSTDEQVMKDNGLSRDMLFDLVKPGEALGTLRAELAEEFGLGKIPVVATANDKAVEALGAGIQNPQSIMISLGTFISAMSSHDHYFEDAKTFFPTLASVPHKFVYESTGIRRGLWTVSWFKRLIGEEITKEAEQEGVSVEDILNLRAADIAPGSDGLITMLDWLASPDTPYRKGVMIGFDQRHTRYHMYRSILEAIAYEMKNNIDAMADEVGLDLREVVVIGGGSKSNVMMQILSDVFGLPVHRRKGSSVACLGAAICATTYLGVYEDFDAATSSLVQNDSTFETDARNHAFYTNVNDSVVKHVRQHTDSILKRMHPIFS
ncbi:sugar kinase [Paenalkalicoccus suaedae]|uniref:Sugar kinase n=1 Tax=Paenalkalicoccus suaedae TaxID=2592382 RepID=A0A859FHG6_9BACI|nr:FGGY-family carbohydrate kinase [Paenalkalicoccus suaedae]QKS72577.1 sugar kinase [Paenalkalicoccus suaedae]